MKFKCNQSGCVYNFESAMDIKTMMASSDYSPVIEELSTTPKVLTPAAPILPTKPAVVTPKPTAPSKPLPDAPVPVVAV